MERQLEYCPMGRVAEEEGKGDEGNSNVAEDRVLRRSRLPE